MVKYLEEMFLFLRPAFSRHAAYVWFVVVWMGIVARSDAYGASSVVRALGLAPESYLLMLHFFHSRAWHVKGVSERWWLWLAREKASWGMVSPGRLTRTCTSAGGLQQMARPRLTRDRGCA